MVQLSYPYMTTGKTIALTRWTIIGKVMSLLFNMLSRFVNAFLPRSKHPLTSWLQSPSAVILETKKIKVSHCFYCFPIYLPWSNGTRCHDLWMLSFKPAFHSSLSPLSRGSSSSSLSAISVVTYVYLRVLVFLLAILIPVYAAWHLAWRILHIS